MRKILFGICMITVLLSIGILAGCGSDVCEHQEETIAGKAATCTETGLTEGKKCSLCQEVLVAQEEIAALGHKEETLPAVAATCTETGLTEGKRCSECKETLIAQEVVPAGHSETVQLTKAPTCTEAGENTYTCGSCSATRTEEVAKLGHTDSLEDNDLVCDRDDCTQKVAPKAETTLSIINANLLGANLSTSNKYYIEAIVAEITDAYNGIFKITDDSGETFLIRMPKNSEETDYKLWQYKIVEGDKIKAYGKIEKYTDGTPYMSAPIVTVLEHEHKYSEANCFYPAICACGHENGEPRGHVDENSDNLCDKCGLDVAIKLASLAVKTNSGMTTAEDGNSISWSDDNIVFAIEKGTASKIYTDSQEHARLTKNNDIRITAKDGKQMVSFTIVANVETQVANWKKLFEAKGYTFAIDGLNITVNLTEPTSEILINCSTGAPRLVGIDVFYK